jgi:glycosyltransferase involved in cell wall biosynthesis
MTKISLGILAWNEEQGIARSLRSLFQQNLLSNTPDWVEAIEVVVVPNGCRDATELRAQEALNELTSQRGDPRIQARVVSLARPGKSNAWNEYVHRLARQDADYVLLMDADIELSGPDVLGLLVEALEKDPVAHVACANPIKDIAVSPPSGLFARLSLSASSLRAVGTVGLCGMLYCARGEALRRVHLPPNLLVEDGFLRAMIATSAFEHPDRAEFVIRVDDAQLIFEAEKTLKGLVRHERRICTGSLVNFMLFAELPKRAGSEGVAEYIRRNNELDVAWLAKFVDEQTAGRVWLVPHDWLVRRFLRAKRANQLVRRLPFLVPASVFDLLVAVLANLELKRGRLAW